MPVMKLGHVDVSVLQRLVRMDVTVFSNHFSFVTVVVMLVIVAVLVFMGLFQVNMRMLMLFGDRKIGPGQHDRKGGQKRVRDRIPEDCP